MENAIVIVILAAIVAAIVLYLVKAKKRGEKCIGCPYAKQCSGKCGNSTK
jgi:radical SAM protein with 4Fe4S-binding SPASM domain